LINRLSRAHERYRQTADRQIDLRLKAAINSTPPYDRR